MTLIKLNEPWCRDPFVHIDIIVENQYVHYKPCNVYAESYSTPDFKVIQRDLVSGRWAEGCGNCKSAESANINSRRTGVNLIHKDKPLVVSSIGLRYGTLCNSTCLICDETRSSAWASKLLKESIPIKSEYIFNKKLIPDLAEVLKDIDCSTITNIELHGGEPLLNSYTRDILDMLPIENLSVKINTNGTVWPEWMDKFTKTKSTEILFSIDDIGDRLEYLRPPANFDVITENIKKSKGMNFKTGCTYVVSSLNVYYLPEFLMWAVKKFGISLYGQFMFDDTKYSLFNLPESAKLKVIEKFNQHPKLTKLLSSVIIEMSKNNTKEDTALYDTIRDNEFKTVFPEWHSILTHA